MLGYQVKTQTVLVGEQNFRIRSLLDHMQYHDPDGEAERRGISPESWPLFGQIWPSGWVLANAMQTADVKSRRVLEIGAGLALASLVVHQRGGDMTASDYHPLIPEFLRNNLRLNGLGPMPYRQANWNDKSEDLGTFDLIIGSDLIYERDQPSILAHFIDRHSAPRVEVLLVDPNRSNRARFRQAMTELGYRVETTSANCLLGNGEAYKGSFLRFHRERSSAAA
jgi:predicted nicotinamide N-methyase